MKNESFITDLIDENRYYDYIQSIEDAPTSIIDSPDFETDDCDRMTPQKMLKYAKTMEKAGNYDKARKCYKNTADFILTQRHLHVAVTTGMVNYAKMCKKGIGGDVDLNEYLKYIKKGVECRDSFAMYEYGLILEKGELVEKDLQEAAKYFKAAADHNIVKALYKTIDYYSKEIGVENIQEALKLCKNPLIENCSKAKRVYKKLLNQLNDVSSPNNQIYKPPPIIMINGKIKFKGKEYFNECNILFSGKESLNQELNNLMRNHNKKNYPQEFNFCKNI